MKNAVSAGKSLNFSVTTMINWEMKEKVCKYKPKIITFRQTENTYFKLLNQELISNVLGMSVKFSLAQMTSMNTGEDCLRVSKRG